MTVSVKEGYKQVVFRLFVAVMSLANLAMLRAH